MEKFAQLQGQDKELQWCRKVQGQKTEETKKLKCWRSRTEATILDSVLSSVWDKIDPEEGFRKLLQEHSKIEGDFPDIDQIYRSRFASKNELPWDILVRFIHKNIQKILSGTKWEEPALSVHKTEIQTFQDLLHTLLKRIWFP